jgi:hypothetical protein
VTRIAIAATSLVVLMAGIAFGEPHRPYAGLQSRPIKALSEQQIDDLRAGRGMGLALAAELNGYPGPIHVLELADRLDLSPAQHDSIKTLLQAVKDEAIPLGERLIAGERELDHAFASKSVTPASLEAMLQAIGATQAALRAAHLKYHLATLEALTPRQVRRYNELRGYSSASGAPSPHGVHRH